MDCENLSSRFAVRALTEADVPAVLDLCRGNPQYYRHCPPAPTEQSVRADMAALPPRKTPEDKYYLGFFEDGALIAVLDLIAGFPRPKTAFWGFFMLRAASQGRGLGTALVTELCCRLRALGFRSVLLGWADGNRPAERFWKKNGFAETGASWDAGKYTVIYAQKELS